MAASAKAYKYWGTDQIHSPIFFEAQDFLIISGIIDVLNRGLQWRDTPREYGIPKTLYNRFVRWSKMGVFDKIFSALFEDGGTPQLLMIDATNPF